MPDDAAPDPDLVTARDIARLLGLAHQQTANNLWRRHRGTAADAFPDPELDRPDRRPRRLWSRRKVEAWARSTGRAIRE